MVAVNRYLVYTRPHLRGGIKKRERVIREADQVIMNKP